MKKKRKSGNKLTPKQEAQKIAIERQCIASGGNVKTCRPKAFAIVLGAAKKKRRK